MFVSYKQIITQLETFLKLFLAILYVFDPCAKRNRIVIDAYPYNLFWEDMKL